MAVLVLAGLFGMHGLGEHSGGHGAMSMAVDAPSSTVHPAGHTHAMAATPGDAAALGSAPVISAPGGSTYGGLATVCLAVLLGGLVMFLLLGSARRRTPWLLPRQVVAPVPLPRSRAPDPPSPVLLSVCRC